MYVHCVFSDAGFLIGPYKCHIVWMVWYDLSVKVRMGIGRVKNR